MTNKIDTNAAFYPGAFTDEQKVHIKKSPLWSLIVGMHFNHNGNLLLTKYQDTPLPDTEISRYRATFSNRTGYPFVVIDGRKSGTTSAYDIWRSNYNNLGQPMKHTLENCVKLMGSTKPQYLLGQMRKGRIISDINTMHRQAEEKVIANGINSTIGTYADQINSVRGTCPLLNSEAQKWAVMVATKAMDIIEIPPSTRLVLEQISAYHSDADTQFNLFIKEVNEMYANDKWMVNLVKDYGYIVGKLSGAPLVERTIERRTSGYCSVKPQHLVWSVHPSFYASLDDMPEPHRTELTAALNHAKINRAGIRTHVDPAQLIAGGTIVQREVYAVTHVTTSDSSWVLVDA